MSREATAASKAIDRFGKKTKVAARGAKTAATSVNALGTSLQRTRRFAIGAVAALAAIGIGAGLGAAVRTLASFAQQMATVRAVTEATDEQFDQLRRTAQDLGIRTRFSATQAAEGMAFLARAGFDTNEVLETIEGTLRLAQAGALGLGRAADIASNVLRGFRLDTAETGRVVDVLALAANSANTTVNQLGEGLKLVAPIAAGFGLTLEQTTAAVSTLSDAGLQASLAGTGLRRVLAELESPSSKTRKTLAEFGITTDQVKISSVGLAQALQVMKDAGLGAAEGLEIFGQRGGPAFEVISQAIPQLVRMTKELGEAGGTAQRVSDIMDDNLNGALLRAKSAFEGLVLAFGQAGAETQLTTFFDAMADSLRFLARNIDTVKRVILILTALLIGRFRVAIITAAAKLIGLGAGFTAATVGAKLFRLALRALGIGLIILAVEKLVGFFEFLNEEIAFGVTNAKLFGAFFRGVFKEVGRVLGDLVRRFGLLGTTIGRLIKRDFKGAAKAASEAFAEGTGDFGFKKAIEDELRELAIVAAERAGRIGVAFGDEIDEGLDAGIDGAGIDAANKITSEFLQGLQAFDGGADAFSTGLQGIVKEFRPAIAAAQEQAEVLELLALAAKATDKELKKFGLTQAEVQGIIKDVNAAARDQLSFFAQEIKNADERIKLIGLENSARLVQTELQKLLNEAKEDGVKLTDSEIAQLEKKLQLEQKLKAEAATASSREKAQKSFNKNVENTIRSLQTERELVGLTGDALERARIITQLKNQATAAGVILTEKQIRAVDMETEALQRAKELFSEDAGAGFRLGVQGFVEDARNLNKQFEEFSRSTLDNATNAFNEFIETGRFNFASFTNSILSDLQRIATNLIFQSLLPGGGGFGGGGGGLGNLFGSLFGGGGGGGGNVVSTALAAGLAGGGVVGKDGSPLLVAASAFKNAKKFQRGGPISGSGTDSVPILATPGEVVLTEDQANVLRNAIAGRSVGNLSTRADRDAGAPVSNATGEGANVTVTVIVNGVTDAASIQRAQGQIAADTARGINRALRRNG